METQNNKKSYTQFRKYYHAIGPTLEKPKNRIYSTLVFSLLAISLFSWYAIKPTIQTILQLKREIVDKTALNEKMEQKIALLIEAQNSYTEAEPLIPLIDEAIPDNPLPVDLADQITKTARESNINISNVNIGESKLYNENEKKIINSPKDPSQSLKTINVSMTVNGNYASLENYLNNLIMNKRIIILQSFNLNNSDQTKSETGDSILNSALSLKSFYE